MHRLLKRLDERVLQTFTIFLLIFIPLYPKLPLLDIRHTWVYIRLEDFLIALLAGIWLILLVKKKISLRTPLTKPIIIYWVIGLLSLLNAIFFLRGQIPHFFPKLAILHYVRRIEYMILFFVSAASIKDLKILKRYIAALSLALILVCFYGFGQRLFNFPAFLTTNEEFAKGQPLFLGPNSRISSTFGGPYDLAAYLVLMIGIFSSLYFGIRKRWLKILVAFLVLSSFVLMLLTASRISLFACLLSMALVLLMQRKKWLIVVTIIVGVILAFLVSGSSERLGKTFRIQEVVYSRQTGLPIATLEDFLAPPKEGLDPNESLPSGSGFLSFGKLSKEEARAQILKRSVIGKTEKTADVLETEITTEKYFVKKAIVYDISFTTRYQGQWPLALNAFKRNVLLGSGYSSLFLASDNDYLRSLGETGILGFLSFFSIFVMFILLAKYSLEKIAEPLPRSIVIGVLAGLFGLLTNAFLIDVFEASKVAYTLWLILGITVGIIQYLLPQPKKLLNKGLEFINSHLMVTVGLFCLTLIVFSSSIKNYFVGDDFSWLKWALSTNSRQEIFNYFVSASGFFYRPLAKIYFYLANPIFGLKPQGYHLFSLLLHFGCAVGAYCLVFLISRKKFISALSAVLFLIHPLVSESVLWISTTSHLMASFFYLWGLVAYISWRQAEGSRRWLFLIAGWLAFTLGLFSHERMVTFPLILIAYDILYYWPQKSVGLLKKAITYLPWIIFLAAYFWLRNRVANAHFLSGDYNYNLKNIIFNFSGNTFGYLGELLIGFRFIQIYDWLRLFLKDNKVLAIAILSTLTIALFMFKNRFIRIFKLDDNKKRLILFSGVWFAINLLIFLGLGNIAERYVYPAHLGFVVMVALSADRLGEKLKRKGIFLAVGGVGIILFLLINFYLWEMANAKRQWYLAGETANKILLTVDSNFSEFMPNSRLYFVNLPIRFGRAWVFPVGFEDGLWHIYRDENLKVEKKLSLEKALDASEGKNNYFVFIYENGELKKATK